MKSIDMAYCTFPSEASAREICTKLAEEGLIACANILPSHQAIYRWRGAVHTESEVGAWLKTISRKRTSLTERIREIHPYEVPCLIFLKIDGGAPAYLKWVAGQCL